MMARTDERIDPKVIEAAADAFADVFYRATPRVCRRPVDEALKAAIRAADRERGLKEEYRPAGPDLYDYPAVRLVSDWRQVEARIMNTHYAVIAFSGDPAGEHPDLELRGSAPKLGLIACGSEGFCWAQLERWTIQHPLRMWEDAEVLARDTAANMAARERQVERGGEDG